MIPYNLFSAADIFTDCQNKFEDDKPTFLSLLESYIDLDEIVPVTFRNQFFASKGKPINTLYTPHSGILSSSAFFPFHGQAPTYLSSLLQTLVGVLWLFQDS